MILATTNWSNALSAINKINDTPKQMIILPNGQAVYLSSMDTINTTTHFVHLAIDANPIILAVDSG